MGVVGLDQDRWRVEFGGYQIVWVLEDGCNVDQWAPIKAPLCKNKEEGGSARAWPVAAPMPKSDSF